LIACFLSSAILILNKHTNSSQYTVLGVKAITTRTVFLYKFLSKPDKIGSITPSSSFLTKRMLENLPWDKIDTIVELGAGTGVFTDFIAANKKESCRVVVLQEDPEMRKNLRSNHPTFLYGAKAEKLNWLLQRYDLPQVDCIISGLPFATFSESLREEIMMAVHRSLKPDGIFLAFQYSLQMKATLQRYFSELKASFVPLNIPPAFVYRCTTKKTSISS
jgi:phospholipid N-methyltransferase